MATGPALRAEDRDVLCLLAGTLISTDQGEVPVEALRPGVLVLTVHGGPLMQPVKWVGRMRVNVARHRDRTRIAPILFRAGSLGEGVPFRDLRVSPDHGMFVGGRLVPARLLVNGSSIVQETGWGEADYHHVELEGHGLIVAEGAVTETYLDDGRRYLFDNADIVALTVDFGALRARGGVAGAPCVPTLAEGAPELDCIRRRLSTTVRTTG